MTHADRRDGVGQLSGLARIIHDGSVKRDLILLSIMALAGCTSTPAQPPTPVNSATAPPPGPVVSGHVLVFSPDEHEVDQSGRADQSTITDDAVAAGMSPDGNTLAYVTQNSRLVLHDLRTKAEKKVTVTVGGAPLSPGKCVRFSPDGKRLALLSRDGGLYVTSLAGAATKIDVPKDRKSVV